LKEWRKGGYDMVLKEQDTTFIRLNKDNADVGGLRRIRFRTGTTYCIPLTEKEVEALGGNNAQVEFLVRRAL
jgi:hypothetical protein